MRRGRLEILTDRQYFAAGIADIPHQPGDLRVGFPQSDHEARFGVDVGALFVTVPQYRERSVVFCLRTDSVV